MRVSVNWLSEWVDLPDTVEELEEMKERPRAPSSESVPAWISMSPARPWLNVVFWM